MGEISFMSWWQNLVYKIKQSVSKHLISQCMWCMSCSKSFHWQIFSCVMHSPLEQCLVSSDTCTQIWHVFRETNIIIATPCTHWKNEMGISVVLVRHEAKLLLLNDFLWISIWAVLGCFGSLNLLVTIHVVIV